MYSHTNIYLAPSTYWHCSRHGRHSNERAMNWIYIQWEEIDNIQPKIRDMSDAGRYNKGK